MPKTKSNAGRETPRLEVYLNRTVLVQDDGTEQEFQEGQLTDATKDRITKIRQAFEEGFLDRVFQECQYPDINLDPLDAPTHALLSQLVGSVTSEQGRAIVGLTVLQLAIKAIAPKQSIRLHKGGGRGSNFSWSDGVPMRGLDASYLTPLLREYGLIRLNADGVFMTRSLAENYPYSKLYKAALRGARNEWLEIVDLIESGKLAPSAGLKHLLTMLFNQSEKFKEMENKTLAAMQKLSRRFSSLDDAIRFITGFVDTSTYSARIFEIALHSFFQVLEDAGAFTGFLKPLSQMRSANKKHGNIGDIEITRRRGGLEILEAWDAKYEKQYLRDEIEELGEKLSDHPETEIAGFVVTGLPSKRSEITERITEMEQLHDVKILILDFPTWISEQAMRAVIEPKKVAINWLIAFTECLCQQRRDRAPIDEPCQTWVSDLQQYAENWS